MKYKLSYIGRDGIDFEKLKEEAVKGIIFSPESVSAENLKMAKKNKFKRFVYLGELTKTACKYIANDGIKSGKIVFASVSAVKNTIKRLASVMSDINGFVIPVPCISGLFWDDSFVAEYEEFCGRALYDELPILFDSDTSYSEVRIWYYNRAAQKIFTDYVLPVCEYIKSLGKTACVDLGNTERGDCFIRKLSMPYMFRKFNISVIREENGERHFVSPTHNRHSSTLFVTAIKDIMGMCVWDFPCSKIENDFSVAVWEEKYYRDSLRKCGIEAYVIDEITMSHMRVDTLKKFSDILLQRETVMDRNVKEKLINMGVRINDANLLKRLDSVN